MPSLIRSGRWWVAHLLVITICVLFVNLGFWQLRRLEERRLQNSVWQARLASAPLQIEDLVTGAGTDLESLEYRPVEARGTFSPEHEILVRSQVWEGSAGFHVITPLVMESGSAILVNRGWVPLDMDDVPVPVAPPEGEVDLVGTIRLSQTRGSVGPTDPATGALTQIARVDISRIGQQMPWPLLPVYVVAQDTDETSFSMPIALTLPDLNDEGPHLAYAIQWFAFALIGVVGYLLLLRRVGAREEIQADRETIDDFG
jgi:surfeit locus 1 family protein